MAKNKQKKQRLVNSIFIDDTVYDLSDPIQMAMYSNEIVFNAAIKSFEIANIGNYKEVTELLFDPASLKEVEDRKAAASKDEVKDIEDSFAKAREIRIDNFKTSVNNHFLNTMKFLRMVELDDKKGKKKSNIQTITPKLIF